MKNTLDLSKATVISGIAATEGLDQQGEVLLLAGADISDMVPKGFFNADHRVGFTNLLGKITEAKKIFSEKDIENENQRHYWEKNNEKPYLWVSGVLFDDPGSQHEQSKAVGTIINQFSKMNLPLSVSMSVEGKIKERTNSGIIKESMIRNVALTVVPANEETAVGAIDPSMVNQIITKCQEIGADTDYASDLIKSINSGIKPIQHRFIEIPDSEIDRLKLVQAKVSKAASLIKGLSVGYGAAGAPSARTGGAALATESVDPKIKSATIPPVKKSEKKSEETEEDKKKKAKKEIFKSLMIKVRKNHPDLPYDKAVEYALEIFRSKKQ